MESDIQNKIKISLIVASTNRSKDLIDFLMSLKKSNILLRKDIEVIIVDNNQTQEEKRKYNSICKKFEVTLLHEKTPGKSYAINTGIAKSSGDYLAFTDDDVIVKNSKWLDIMMENLKNNPKLGYVAGNVIALKTETQAEKIWESKGGLSKGPYRKHWTKEFLNRKKFKIYSWPFYKICAGANSMIPKKVIQDVGPYNILLENPIIEAGGTVEIGYRIAKKGYELLYVPEAKVYHKHPKTKKELKQKMMTYGVGDTARAMCIFIEHKDFRYLWWGLFGHTFYTISKILKRIFGKYNFPLVYIIKNLQGNIIGWMKFLFYYYYAMKRQKDQYKIEI